MDQDRDDGLVGGLSEEDLGLVPEPEEPPPPPARIPHWAVFTWLVGGSILIFGLQLIWQAIRGEDLTWGRLLLACTLGPLVVGTAIRDQRRAERGEVPGSLNSIPLWVQAAVTFVMFTTVQFAFQHRVSPGGNDVLVAGLVGAAATVLLMLRHSFWFVVLASLLTGIFGIVAIPVLSLVLWSVVGYVEAFLIGVFVGLFWSLQFWFLMKRAPNGGPSMITIAVAVNGLLLFWIFFASFAPRG
jgi:hypothetical protein